MAETLVSLMVRLAINGNALWQDEMHRSNDEPASLDGGAVSFIEDSHFLDDVFAGLSAQCKFIPCKYLYDERGSKLFDAICDLDEYYPTRTELQITIDSADEIGECIGPDAVVVEYGSGSSLKTRVLLDHLQKPSAYLPIDISEDHLLATADKLRADYPQLKVRPIVADFTQGFELPEDLTGDHVCVYFPGSTIGNLKPVEAEELLEKIASQCGHGGGLLIGFDLQKDVSVLELAYDDPQGVTAKFSLNLLSRINRELDADFEVENFRHLSFYNAEDGRIEIYIESLCDQTVTIADRTFGFEKGERIHTEYSHKYTVEGFAKMASQAGFQMRKVWTDSKKYFAVAHFVVE